MRSPGRLIAIIFVLFIPLEIAGAGLPRLRELCFTTPVLPGTRIMHSLSGVSFLTGMDYPCRMRDDAILKYGPKTGMADPCRRRDDVIPEYGLKDGIDH